LNFTTASAELSLFALSFGYAVSPERWASSWMRAQLRDGIGGLEIDLDLVLDLPDRVIDGSPIAAERRSDLSD
jgi:hypothetical protein